MRTGNSAGTMQSAAESEQIRLAVVTNTPPIVEALKPMEQLCPVMVAPDEVWGGTWLGCDVAILHADPTRPNSDGRALRTLRTIRSTTRARVLLYGFGDADLLSEALAEPMVIGSLDPAASTRNRRPSRCGRCRPHPGGSP